MDETIIPYELPNKENHSFFFVDIRITPALEAKLHQHDAWELYYVIHGYGSRIAGDTVQPFSAGDVVLIPPAMQHRWKFVPDSADKNGNIRYLMIAFNATLVLRCIEIFPELRNRMADTQPPAEALRYGVESSYIIRKTLKKMNGMNELDRLCEMFRLLPVIFGSTDHVSVGKPIRIELDVRRMQKISTYVMAHYVHPIALKDIATEVGMSRSAFCSYFKRTKGMTFSQFVCEYRINTACELLKHSQKQVSEICFMVGFNDMPHFVRVFTKAVGISPLKYRKKFSK